MRPGGWKVAQVKEVGDVLGTVKNFCKGTKKRDIQGMKISVAGA